MFKTEDVDIEKDTGEIDIQRVILEELHAIRGDLGKVGKRIEKLEERVGGLEEKTQRVVADLHMIYNFHQSYSARLQAIERICDEIPLRSPKPTPIPPDGAD